MDQNEQIANDCIKKLGNLKQKRSTFENHWTEVAELVRPMVNFFNTTRTPGEKVNTKIFDSTAPLALPKFAAAVISMAFPPTQKYHRITIGERDLQDNVEVKRYLDELNNRLFEIRYAPHANWQSQTGEMILDVGAFGTGILFIDDFLGRGIRYKAIPLSQAFIGENEHGDITTLYRVWEWDASQFVSAFGLNKLPEKIQEAYQSGSSAMFEIMHCVQPNKNKIDGALDYNGMDFESYYIVKAEKHVISKGGYRTFPYAVPSDETAPNEVYGRSPAMRVLPTIKTLNQMKKTILRAAHMQVQPPIMLSDDGAITSFNLRPNALNYGSVDDNGRPKAIPFNNGARVELGMDLMNAEREAINDAFFVTLFRILVEEPRITATEAMLRAQEKGQLLAPSMGRIQAKLLGPTVERELDVLMQVDAGTGRVLPIMPAVLQDYFANGGEYKLEYQAPLNLAQKAGEGTAILNTLNALAPMAQIDNSITMRFDVMDMAEKLARINGVPESSIRSDDEVADLQEQKATAEQAKQLLDAAPVAAGAAKDLAQAASLAGSAPNQVAPDLGLI